MTLDVLLEKVRQGERVSFRETIQTIEENFEYKPVQFTNGLGENLVVNPPGKNEGSCKIFALGKRCGLSKEETLSLFGELYWKDVVESPGGTDHANIRAFIRYGWDGIEFSDDPLKPRNG